MNKGKAGKGVQRPRRKPGPRAPLAGLAVAAAHHRLSPIARSTAAVLEDLSWSRVKAPVVMVGYGGVADEKKRPDGLAEATKHCRRSAMRGVRELERAGLLKIGGKTRPGKAYGGRRSWFQRVGGRLDDGSGKGRSNEYGPGQALGVALARPRPGPVAVGDEESPEQLMAVAANKRGLAQLLVDEADKLEARAGP